MSLRIKQDVDPFSHFCTITRMRDRDTYRLTDARIIDRNSPYLMHSMRPDNNNLICIFNVDRTLGQSDGADNSAAECNCDVVVLSVQTVLQVGLHSHIKQL